MLKLYSNGGKLSLISPPHLIIILHSGIKKLSTAITVPNSLCQALFQVPKGTLNSNLKLQCIIPQYISWKARIKRIWNRKENNAWDPTSPLLSKLSNGPLMVVPRTSRIVDSRTTFLPKAKRTLYHEHIDVLEPITTSNGRNITKLRDMLITPERPQGHTWKVPCTTLNAHQRDTKQTNTMGSTLPPNDSPLDSLCLVSGTHAKQIPQPTNGVPSKRKIKGYSDLNSILPQEPSGLYLRYHT